MRYSDSGVVMRMSGGVRSIWRRTSAGVSPVRSPTVGSRNGSPRRSAAARMPAMGARRFLSTSTASARSGDTYTSRVPAACGGGPLTRRSMPHRKAASVLPEPVGARMSVWSPPAMAGHPWVWAGVGSGKLDSNQARTGGENSDVPTSLNLPRGCDSARPRARSGVRSTADDATNAEP